MGCGASSSADTKKQQKDSNEAAAPASAKASNQVQKYSITVYTGDKVFAGTDARVFVRMNGQADSSDKLELTNDTRDDDNTMEKGDKNTFIFNLPAVGTIMSVDVSHDGSGHASGWFLEKVTVIDHEQGERYVFPCHHWIKKGRGRNLTPLPKAVTAPVNPDFEITTDTLSSPHHMMKPEYDVIVIGSGYGGSIAASRFARSGKKVALLEKGREFQPGSYPTSQAETLGELQISGIGPLQGRRNGLYDFTMGDDISVFKGCGLGGTSLVNANVALPPKDYVFDDPKWPKELRGNPDELGQYIQQASIMLSPAAYPSSYPRLHKAAALEKAGNQLGEKFYYPPLTVTWEDRINEAGINQAACNNCGNCMTGCNYGAKNTLIANYIPDAKNHGAEIYCQMDVRSVTQDPSDGQWIVSYQSLASGFERFDAPNLSVRAATVVLAAGALGSTEILLRSKAAGLSASDKVGHGFTGNGDMLAFAWNADEKVASVGLESQDPNETNGPGPCISGIVDARDKDMKKAYVIEDGTPPGGAANILQTALMMSSKLIGKDTDGGLKDELGEAKREAKGVLRGPFAEGSALQNTLAYLVMSHDDSEGKLELNKDEIKVNWPDVGKQPIFAEVNGKLAEATKALGGTFVRNPTWSKALGDRIVTVHPLGGCNMADTGATGATDHKGRVFSGNGTDVHKGLYVCDGAVVPRSVGVNPFLTIAGLAERIVYHAIKDLGATSNYEIHPRANGDIEALSAKPYKDLNERKVGIYFTESMVGYISGSYDKKKEGETDFQSGYRLGKKKPKENNFRFILTASTPDLDAMLSKDPNHHADLHGTVTCKKLSPSALTVTQGRFGLFSPEPDAPNDPDRRRMTYSFVMTSVEGKKYYFEGYKLVSADMRLGDPWKDTTTLFIKVWEGEDGEGKPFAMGKLKIQVKDFVTQLGTMRVTNAKSKKEKLAYLSKFGLFFAGQMWNVYMPFGTVADEAIKNRDKPIVARRRRQLRVEPPKVYHVWTDDDVRIRLTRYCGGKKGPVLLIHGLSLGSNQHTWDAVDTNMVEYLYAKGYDVWNYDWRCSHFLDTQTNQYTMDDVARFDHPAAIKKILAKTGAQDLQVVSQCVGSITIDMALLGGWVDPKHIRSLVNFNSATHYNVIPYRTFRAGVYQPEIMAALGITGGYSDSDYTVPKGWEQVFFHEALDFLAKHDIHLDDADKCDSNTCHRLTYLWGLIWEHSNLNAETHKYQHELFGFASVSMFKHLAAVVRKGHICDKDGNDVYMKGAQNLDVNTLLIGGAKNKCWSPESLQRTYDWLTQDNGFKNIELKYVEGYGHNDCSVGKDAMDDVFPLVTDFLDKHNSE